MAFRVPDSVRAGRERAFAYLITRDIPYEERETSRMVLDGYIEHYGPVVDAYPAWHPLVAAKAPVGKSCTIPGAECGYVGLANSVLLRNAIITCPRGDDDSALIESVHEIGLSEYAAGVVHIDATKIETPLFHHSAKPVLIHCRWLRSLEKDGTIPASFAVPLFLEREVPAWRSAPQSEDWETMSRYALGLPGGSRSSLFVNQETGQAIKNIWKALVACGVYGPAPINK